MDNVPAVAAAAAEGRAMFGTVDSWLIYQLTGETTSAGLQRTAHRQGLSTSLQRGRSGCGRAGRAGGGPPAWALLAAAPRMYSDDCAAHHA